MLKQGIMFVAKTMYRLQTGKFRFYGCHRLTH